MEITYDKVANAVYIAFKATTKVNSTVQITDDINLNLDYYKNVVGIEVLRADKVIDLTELVVKNITE